MPPETGGESGDSMFGNAWMHGMGTGPGWIVLILVVAVLVLAIAALVKYLRK